MKTKIFLFLIAGLLASPLFAQQNVPELAFDSVPNFFKLPPGMNFGEVPGVAVNSKGHVFVFTRSNSANGPAYAPAAAQLFEFGPDGAFIREIGKGLYAWSEAHSVRIDKDDNIWAIDKGSDMVIKFNQAGRVVWVFGRRAEGADEESKPWGHPNPPLPAIDGLFRQPTDVAWDSDGNIYITDGYVNSRVAKYDKNGDWVKSWGSKGTAPGQFRIPHTIVIDRNDNLYVGDRTNRRIQVFNTDGKFQRMFTIDVPPAPGTKAVNGPTPTGERLAAVIGAPNAICITNDPTQVLFVGESTFPGRIFKVALDGTVLGVIGRSGRQLGQFSGAHQLACPTEHEVYAAETSNWRVQKLLLRGTQPAASTRVEGNRLAGTWHLDSAKSTFDSGQRLKSQTRIYTVVGDGQRATIESVDAAGHPFAYAYTARFDGAGYPLSGRGMPGGADSIAIVKIDASTITATLKKNGKDVMQAKLTVSGDGKLLTIQRSGVSNSVLVFNKQ